MNTQSTLKTGTASVSPTEPAVAAPLNTKTLFPLGSRERTIVHDNTEYRLRITAQGKLILTK